MVVAVGAREIKNPLILADACEMVGAKLVVTGHATARDIKPGFEWLLPPKKLFDKKNVIFTGLLNQNEMRQIFSEANVFVNSSREESFCLAAYEAAANGVPLCLPKIETFEVFKNSALFHNPYNSNQLAKNIELLLENKSTRTKNTKQAKRIAKEFEYKKVRKLHEEFYAENGFL